MLKKEVLKAQKELSNLTDEQLSVLETLSKNDEESVIGKKVGEIYREIDAKIELNTGVKRDGDEKTYIYLDRATKEVSEKSKQLDVYKKSIDDLTAEKSRLQKVIDDGAGSEEIKNSLEQAKKDLNSVKSQFSELKEKSEKEKTNFQNEIFSIKVNGELNSSSSNLTFKKDLPSSVTKIIKNQVFEKIQAMNPEFIDDGKGGKVLAFKDEKGAILRNPEDQLNPYTAKDLMEKEFKTMGVLDEGRKAKGAGTNPPALEQNKADIIDVSTARTRVEANDAIHAALSEKGLTAGSEEYQEEMSKAYEDNNIKDLPFN